MDVFEITDFKTGISDAGVNYLQPSDSFQNLINGFIYRQVLQSRQGVGYFAPRLDPISPLTPPVSIDSRRVYGIFEHTLVENGSKELLVFDANFCYKFNTSTGIFDQIPFGGTMTPGGVDEYAGFQISAKDAYISGTSYPNKNNQSRFVFVSSGITPNNKGSAILYYDNTSNTVLDYTDIADNADYTDPPQGALTTATYTLWFNERLNFGIPVIAGDQYNQGLLYSGIRTAGGDGDKFDVPGSGLFQADTYQNMTGLSILGQILAVNFDRMAYTLEKTRDAFNPYFGRAVPGVLGTNAKFSATSWDDAVKSIGKTGILATTGRQNLRTDDKIPNFTRDVMDQIDFNLTYGGFDRVNNQFLWAFKQADDPDDPVIATDTQDAVLVNNYEEKTWAIFTQRFSVLGQTDLGLNLTWDDIDETSGNISWAEWDTTSEIWDNIGHTLAVQKTLAGDDLGFIYDINQDYDDYFTTISAVTPGTTTTLTVSENGIKEGDLLTISNIVGMLDINGNSGINNYDTDTSTKTSDFYTVISSTDTSIVINLDSSNLTAYTSGGTVSVPISFNAEMIPFNPYRGEGKRVYVSHIEFYIETNGGDLTIDLFADQQETPFKANTLLKPTATTQKAEWVSVVVDQEANFITFVLKQQSPSVQLKISSVRIHCDRGGLTSG